LAHWRFHFKASCPSSFPSSHKKGGVGKSTLARALAAVAAHFLRVRLADLDAKQATVSAWNNARKANPGHPGCEVVAYASLDEALAASDDVDLLICDAPAGANRQTLELAEASDLIVQPTGASANDLRPAVLLFHELVKVGIPRGRLLSAICRIMSDTEEKAARGYVQSAGYAVLPGSIPERSTYREAQNRGATITETPLRQLNQRADALMEALLEAITDAIRAWKERKQAGAA
jgi:chromosome partitioning protein